MIFGSTGLVGSELCSFFSQQGYEVLTSKSCPILANFSSIDLYFGKSDDAIAKSLKRFCPDIILNAAWTTAGDFYNSPLNEKFSSFAIKLFDTSKVCSNATYVGFGTSAEYGSNPGVCDEVSTPLVPYNSYSMFKVDTFHTIRKRALRESRQFVWLRLFNAFGMRQSADRFLKALSKVCATNGKMVIRSGETVLDWISVQEISRQIELSIKYDLKGPLNIGTGNGVSIRKVVEIFTQNLFPDSKPSIDFIDSEVSLRIAHLNSKVLSFPFQKRENLVEALTREFA